MGPRMSDSHPGELVWTGRAKPWRGASGSRLTTCSPRRTRAAPLSGPDLALLAEVAYAAGRLDVTIDAWERAHAQSMRAGDRLSAAGAAVRVAMHLLFDTALMAPVRGWISRAERLLEGQDETPVHAWLAVVRNYERLLSGDFQSARRVGPARHRGRREVRSGRGRDRPGRRGPQPHPGRRRRAGLGPAQRSGRGHGLRRARSPLHGARLLRAGVCAPGARAVRPGRGVDGGDGAVAPRTARREHPRTLPRPPRRDPPAARPLRRGGAGSPSGLRGASPLPAPGARVAADRTRPHPAAHGATSRARKRHSAPHTRSGGTRSPASPWCIWPRVMSPWRPGPSETRSTTR